MLENSPQPIPLPPPMENHVSESSPNMGSPQVITISSPASSAGHLRNEETTTTTSPDPRNCHSVVITSTKTVSGGSLDAYSGNTEHPENRDFNLRRGSSSEESISESNVYTIPIKYRSGIGSFEEHVAYGFANLFSSSELSDVTIACEGKLIKAHKLVLAISSPYFRQIFEELHDFPCQHPVVILHGVKLKDWENIMRLIYCGQITISSTEVEDFISTAECLKIDGLAAEDPGSSHEDATPPYEYFNRLSSSTELQSPEEPGATDRLHYVQHRKSRSLFPSYSSEDFNTAKDYTYDRRGNHSPDHNLREESGDADQDSLLIRCRKIGSSGTRRTISSAQSSPGLGTHSVNQDSLLKVETHESYGHGGDTSQDAPRPPSCPEGMLNAYSQPSSPVESRVHAVRHPVILRRRDASTESVEDAFEISSPSSGFLSSARMVITSRNSRPSPYPSGWEHRNQNTPNEAVVIDDTERHFPTVISGRRSPILPNITTASTGHGVTTRYPLSVISRQPPAGLPLQQIFNPGAAGFLQRMPPLHLLAQGQRSPHGDVPINTGGVITTVPSPHSSPQSHDHQQSTLAILRAKIATGQSIYTRGYRPDRQHPHPNLFMPRFPSALGSAQISPHPHDGMAGPSRPNIFIPSSGMASHNQHQQSMARPKTKAIRSSQVPQSARYTAAEVDSMVDKVQNFPGNMVPCAICSKFVKRERLRAHIHECHLLHGKRIVCPHCGIGLKSKGSYRVHIWRHKRGALPASRQRHSELHQPHSGSQNPQ